MRLNTQFSSNRKSTLLSIYYLDFDLDYSKCLKEIFLFFVKQFLIGYESLSLPYLV